MSNSERESGLILTSASAVIWGTVFVSISYGLQYLNPYALVFMRFFIASIPVLISIPLLDTRLGILRELKRPSNWYVGSLYAFGFVIQYLGQSMTNASDTALLSNLSPIIAPVGAYIVLKDKLSKGQKLALPLGLLGLVLVAGPKLSLELSGFVGDLLLFVTSITVAAFIILSKKMKIQTLGASFALLVIIAVYLAPVGLLGGLNLSALESLGTVGWESILWTAIPCTLITLALYLRGLARITVSESAILLLVQVIIGLVLADVILSEGLGTYELVGAVILCVAVLLSSLSLGGKKEKEKAELRSASSS